MTARRRTSSSSPAIRSTTTPGTSSHFAAAFAGLRAPLGVFAVAGNHDVYAGWAEVRPGLKRWAFSSRQRGRELSHGGDRFWLGGTGDPAGGRTARSSRSKSRPTSPNARAAFPPGASRSRLPTTRRSGRARRARRAPDAQRPHALRSALDPANRVEPRVTVPRARDGLAPPRRFAALHQSRHELLGSAAPPRRAAGSNGIHAGARPRRGVCAEGGEQVAARGGGGSSHTWRGWRALTS